MHYQQLFLSLKKLLKAGGGDSPEAAVSLKRYQFTSPGSPVLPGRDKYYCKKHDITFEEHLEPPSEYKLHPLHLKDNAIEENKFFPYYVVFPIGGAVVNGVILLFHGLNEKNWDKYLPWAATLVQKTGKAVVLFPIAFHMDRAPKTWSDIKEMNAVAQLRQQKCPDCSNISYINTAVSIRLADQPERLFWSGLQTYLDVIMLVKKIKRGQFERVAPEATIDLFGYSIGAFLSIILLMANPRDYFGKSRLFAFCGGATLDRTFPISKYILDSYGGQRLNSYFSEQLYNHFRSKTRLAHYMKTHKGEHFFKFMLHYNHYKTEREGCIAEIGNRILAVPLKKDTIAPPVEILATLQGDFREIPTRVEPMDFNYPYDHVHPFSLMDRYQEQTDSAFEEVMQKAADFLR